MLKWKIGGITVTQIVEQQVTINCTKMLPRSTVAELDRITWMTPFRTDIGELRLSIHALVIDTPTKRIVVDTCMGNDKPRIGAGNMMKTDFIERFEAAGFPRDSIDVVLCTHLHIDHVGWNTMFENNRWVPTFPQARYLIARGEFEYWRDRSEQNDATIFADSVQPIYDAGLMDLVGVEHQICDEVKLIPTPGHSPGHVSVSIHSCGEAALITGDSIHSPAQMARPDWASFVDYDQDQSIRTRKALLEEVADKPVLVIGTHFVAPTAGVVVRDGHTYKFQTPVES